MQTCVEVQPGKHMDCNNTCTCDILWHFMAHLFLNKMQTTNPNAHMYVLGTDVETQGYAVTQSTFLQYFIWTVLYIFPLLPVCSVE